MLEWIQVLMANWENQIGANNSKSDALGFSWSISFRYDLYPIYRVFFPLFVFICPINKFFINSKKDLHKILDEVMLH